MSPSVGSSTSICSLRTSPLTVSSPRTVSVPNRTPLDGFGSSPRAATSRWKIKGGFRITGRWFWNSGSWHAVMHPGRSAVVAPLDLADLRAIYRLRRAPWSASSLDARVCRSPTKTWTISSGRPSSSATSGLRMDAIHQAHHAFHLPLFAPAATAWDVRILMTLWRAAERYIRIGFGRLDPDPNEHQRREHAHVDLIAAFRRRDPDAAADAVNTHLTHNETIAHHALTPLHG